MSIRKAILAVMICGVLAAFVAAVGPAWAQDDMDLGTIQFPTSGSPEAQAHFIRGVSALHSFWYEEAAEAFQMAYQTDPDFAMRIGARPCLTTILYGEMTRTSPRRARHCAS